MKSVLRIIITMSFLCNSVISQSLQKITLDSAYTLMNERYPLLKSTDLIKASQDLTEKLIDIDRRPAINLKAEGRVQTESVGLDVDEGVQLPFEIDQPLYSVKTFAEAHYTIFDGGLSDARKTLSILETKLQEQSIEVSQFALREWMNTIVVKIIQMREQIVLFDISLESIAAQKGLLQAGVDVGTALQSDVDEITVRELELEAQKENTSYIISGLLRTFEYFIGQSVDPDIEIQLPAFPDAGKIPVIDRPELGVFNARKELVLAQARMLDAAKKPKLVAFSQIGIGYPDPLNFIDDNVAPYGLIGGTFVMPITDWNKTETEKDILALKAEMIRHEKETFEFTLGSRVDQFHEDIGRIVNQIDYARSIAQLKADILSQKSAQLEEGVITPTDYLLQFNAELQSRQKLAILETELLTRQLQFYNERGGF